MHADTRRYTPMGENNGMFCTFQNIGVNRRFQSSA